MITWKKNIKVHDCSNSSYRPKHKGGGGPVMNDIMRYLHENAAKYGCQMVDKAEEADVIITNDVYPPWVLETDIPRVKRMCAPYWQSSMAERNVELSRAAIQSDCVIFISAYSFNMFNYKYSITKEMKIIKHWVDPNVFKNTNSAKRNTFTFVACATDWSRKEKRFDAIRSAAKMLRQYDFLFIGKASDGLKHNCTGNCKFIGYLESPKHIAKVLNSCHAFINLSYRDAATKTVPQALSCGLPIIISNSGGVPETARFNNGVCGQFVPDSPLYSGDQSPVMVVNNIVKSIDKIYFDYSKYVTNIKKYINSDLLFSNMLNEYFTTIRETANRKQKNVKITSS